MNMLAQIVVYRSQFERDRDQFFYENADYILYILVGMLFIGFVLHWFSKRR